MVEKIKVLTLGDMPLSPSGVGTQSRYVIEALLKSGKYQVVSMGGAIKHKKYQPMKTEEFRDDWVIYPVDGFGNPEILRSVIRNEKPDILWFMTDPRFYGWLWNMEDEIRPLMPMVYYHVWDNFPPPRFNRDSYLSTDHIVSISKVTNSIVEQSAPEVSLEYLPHAVNSEIFRKLDDENIKQLRKDNFKSWKKDKFLYFWNNRNARRKMSGSVVWWFNEVLEKVGRDNAVLLMHTDPFDPNGPNLQAILDELGLNNGEIMFSKDKIPPEGLAAMYNIADCTVNISDAEGFGLATLESLSCETPIIVNMTGGLQEQVTDGEKWFGIGIEPAASAVIGSQGVPYIYEDRVSKEDFVNAMVEMYNKTPEERAELGRLGREHVEKNYNFDNFKNRWVEIIDEIHEKHGSWATRKGHKTWEVKEIL
tara:strand:- start:831 stop:2093 length:1263 start_codon:yes stop_codon:yes gene_type:complete